MCDRLTILAKAHLLIAVLLFVAACDPNRLEHHDYSDFSSYEFSQGIGLSFCPDPSMAFTASIDKRSDEALYFGASVLRPTPTGDDDCPSALYADEGCMTVEALPPRRLNAAEVADVVAAFSALEILPEPDPQCKVLGIDPCRIDRHSWDSASHDDYVCSADRLPAAQSERLLSLLSGLLAATER